MPKNIVVCSDGTGQDGAVRLDARQSNIYKLFHASRIGPDTQIDPAEQIAFYDPGLGTDSDSHGFSRIGKTLYKWGASVAGRGIGANIADCYEFIINHWQAGDRIFIFGFSRGAYTARCVAQVLSLCGVPTHASNDKQAPFRRFGRGARKVAERAVHQVYEHGAGYPRATYQDERNELARRFRDEFGSDDDGAANANPYFIGVFDTVAALGASGWKYYGIIIGLTLVALALVAGLAGIAVLLPAWLLWRLLILTATVALLLAIDRVAWAIGAGVVLLLAAAVMPLFGLGMALPRLGFWMSAVAIGVIALGSALIKLRHDSYRYIDNFKGVRRKGHHISWRADNYDRGLSRRVQYARHATSLDETRADFPKVGWGSHDNVRDAVAGEPDPFVQLYFAGNHSDIGGSYPEPESRLSDVALQWMLNDVTSLPEPLLVERSRIQPYPDALGMQHNEPASVRQNMLWWVPAWMPPLFRQGWAEKPRLANGFPVHPSVLQRLAAQDVDQYGARRAYRPANLEVDPRFASWFRVKDPEVDQLMIDHAAASYACGSETPFAFQLGKVSAELAALIKTNDAVCAIGIFPGDPKPTPDTQYLDALAFTMLSDAVRHAKTDLITRTARMKGALPERGLMIFGMEADAGRMLARSFNARTLLTADADGRTGLNAIVE